jgi:putative acetyltransferase
MSGGEDSWYGLGPISVEPALQKTGIGSQLIREGLARLRQMDGAGCVLVGSPAYYRRFGFDHVQGLSAEGEPADYFMALALKGQFPSGIVAFHPGFYGGAA